MQLRIHHIVLAFSALAFLAGSCSDPRVLDTDRTDILFGASTVQLEEETKNVNALDHRTAFSPGDDISVYAWHRPDTSPLFNGQTVTCPDPANGTWTYSPKEKWRWQDNDYYDFLAIPLKVGGVSVPISGVTYIPPSTSSPFGLSVPYDARTDHYDLLMAGTRRRVTDENPSDVVQLNFQHMLSAVKVIFYRDSGSQKFVITSFRFDDLVVSADIVGYWDEYAKKFTVRADNTERTHQKQFGEDRNSAEPWLEEDKFVDTYDPGFYDLLIPQNLVSDDSPSLVVTFRDDVDPDYNEYKPEPIPLKDIIIKNSGTPGTPITRWEPGHVYVYEVHIMLNGGVLVNVTTTKWEDVPAQTPGLMI